MLLLVLLTVMPLAALAVERAAAAAAPPTEPVVHQIWVGGQPGPVKLRYMQTVAGMARRNGARYVLWGNEHLTPENFPRLHSRIAWCVERRRPWAMVADLMQYEILLDTAGCTWTATSRC